MINIMRNQYKISDRDMRYILKADYFKYKRATEKNKYLIINGEKKENVNKTEIINKWKKADIIKYNDIENIQNEYKMEIEEIREIFNISKRNLEKIKQDREKEIKINLYSEKDKQECINKICTQKKYKASKKLIEQIAENERISIEKAGEILGIPKNPLKNVINDKQLTTKIINNKIKYKVEKLALDLKYLKNYGERYYEKQEIALISLMYEISVDDILYYLANGITMYNTYVEALNNNPSGVWIGEKTRLSNKYLEENYEALDKYITRIAKNVRMQFFANDADEKDFKSEAFEYIIRYGGIYEKNLYHNPEKLNLALIKNVQNIMKSYYCKLPKDLALILRYNGKEFENEEALLDNYYNPEIHCLENEYSYFNEICELHTEIVQYFKEHLDFAINYHKNCFAKIAGKYNLTEKMFNQTLSEIQVYILKNKLARIDKNGRIISMFYIEE